MQLYKFTMYLSMVLALSGVIQGLMIPAYTTTPWFPGAQYPTPDQGTLVDFSNMSAAEKAMQPDQGKMLVDGGSSQGISAMWIFWSAVHGVFGISTMINTLFNVPDPNDPKTNLFEPVGNVIQYGIWLIYSMGFLQIFTKMMYKYAY